jgi:hypothetical protein
MKTKFAGIGLLAVISIAGLGMPALLAQGPPPPYWGPPPAEFREVARMGFFDGMEGARHDYDNHRRPDVNNRWEFRHPHVPWQEQDDYRRGFERGYRVGVEHLYGDWRRPY